MSAFLPEQTSPEGAPLLASWSTLPQATDQDVALASKVVAALISRPQQLLGPLMSYVIDAIQVSNLMIPIGQVVGFQQFTPFIATTAGESHFTSTTFADPNVSGPAGPELDTLPAGHYVCLFGGSGQMGGGDNGAFMGISANGAAIADADSAETQSLVNIAVARGTIATLDQPSNTLAAKYKTATAHDSAFRYRWLIAIKYDNI